MHTTTSQLHRAHQSIRPAVRPAIGTMIAAVAALVVLPGCGSLVDVALEEASEQVGEELIGAEIDHEDGLIVISNDEGTVSISTDEEGVLIEAEDADGTETGVLQATEEGVTIETENADGVETATIATGSEVPDGLGVPIAPGGQVEISNVYEDSSARVGQVTIRYPNGAVDQVADFYFDHFDGDSAVETFDLDSSEGRIVTFAATDETLVSIQDDAPGVLVFIQTHLDQ